MHKYKISKQFYYSKKVLKIYTLSNLVHDFFNDFLHMIILFKAIIFLKYIIAVLSKFQRFRFSYSYFFNLVLFKLIKLIVYVKIVY